MVHIGNPDLPIEKAGAEVGPPAETGAGAVHPADPTRGLPSASDCIDRIYGRLERIEQIMLNLAVAGSPKRAALIRSAQRCNIEIARRLVDLTEAS